MFIGFFGLGVAYTPNYNLDDELRSPKNVVRDQYRNPRATLNFFQMKSDDDVLEVLPGSGYYTEILLPLVGERGSYVAAHYPTTQDQLKYRFDSRVNFENMLSRKYGDLNYDIVAIDELSKLDSSSFGVVLTFRNIHSLIKEGTLSAQLAEYLRLLRPGGRLGIVQHEADLGLSLIEAAKLGYVQEDELIRIVKESGFISAGTSAVNNNSLDDGTHENGVWSLPPSLKGGDVQREKFEAIGESNRMTLLFVKPIR